MSLRHGQIGDVEAAVELALSRGRTRIDDVAQILYISRSTLQRRIRPLTFTEVRRQVQLRLALKGLATGRSVAAVAEEVVLSRDHLRLLVKDSTGLSPADIAKATRLAAHLRRWKSEIPPSSGTYAYRRRIWEWNKTNRRLQSILGQVAQDSLLAPWAKQLSRAGVRPDNRRRPNRTRIQEARNREREGRAQRRKREAERLEALHEEAELSLEGKSLLEQSSLFKAVL